MTDDAEQAPDNTQENPEKNAQEAQPNPKNRGLGRGLNALFEDEEGIYPQADQDGHTPGKTRNTIGIEQLERGMSQPRRLFKDDTIEELASSIAKHGILQPLLIRPKKDREDIYEIIAGERRWQAAQKAGLHEVPVIILNVSDIEAIEMALIENLQREDLDIIDEASAYKNLMEEYGYTQEKLAQAVGKSRSHVANILRLIHLPSPIQDYLLEGKISMGHARALIGVDGALAIANEIVKKGLSVRQAENLVAEAKGQVKAPRPRDASPQKRTKDVDTLALENELSNTLGMRVSIDGNGKKGAVTIQYQSLDQLDEVLQRITQKPPGRLLE